MEKKFLHPRREKGVGRKIKHTMRKLNSKIPRKVSLKKVLLCSGQ